MDQISVKEKPAAAAAASAVAAASTEISNSVKPFRDAECLHKALEIEAERSLSRRRPSSVALCVSQINSKRPTGRGTAALPRQQPSYPLMDAGGGLSSAVDFRGEIVNPLSKPAPTPTPTATLSAWVLISGGQTQAV